MSGTRSTIKLFQARHQDGILSASTHQGLDLVDNAKQIPAAPGATF